MVSSVVTFLIVLSVLVLVHELGHFIAARRAGIYVEEFGFGLPPRLFGKKFGETLYSINLLPFGGFVRMHGENFGDSVKQPERAFLNKSAGVKAIIVMAGVVMNFLLAVVAFAIVYSALGIPRDVGHVEIVDVMQSTPAEEVGLVVGDIIENVDGRVVKTNEEFIDYIEEKKGGEVTLNVVREGKVFPVRIIPRVDPPEGEGALGVIITDSEVYFPPVWQRPFLGAYFGFKEAIFWGGAVLAGFKNILLTLFSGKLPTDIAGPAGLYVITSEVAKVGFLPLLNWVGVISVNLAILNAIPIPALDGGRLLFIGAEKLFGRRVIPKIEAWLQMVSMGLLILFLLVITYREVRTIMNVGFSGYLDFLTSGQGLQ